MQFSQEEIDGILYRYNCYPHQVCYRRPPPPPSLDIIMLIVFIHDFNFKIQYF